VDRTIAAASRSMQFIWNYVRASQNIQLRGSSAPGTLRDWWRKSRISELGVTVVELMPIFQRDPRKATTGVALNFFSPHANTRHVS
jgi:hypothetical protein